MVVGKAGPQVFFFSCGGAVRAPVEGIDGQGFGAGGNEQGIGDVFRLAVEGDDHSCVVLSCGCLQVGELVHLLRGQPPANGVAGHQELLGVLLGKAVLHQADAHIGPLGKACQDNGLAVVVVVQVVEESLLYVLIG